MLLLDLEFSVNQLMIISKNKNQNHLFFYLLPNRMMDKLRICSCQINPLLKMQQLLHLLLINRKLMIQLIARELMEIMRRMYHQFFHKTQIQIFY